MKTTASSQEAKLIVFGAQPRCMCATVLYEQGEAEFRDLIARQKTLKSLLFLKI